MQWPDSRLAAGGRPRTWCRARPLAALGAPARGGILPRTAAIHCPLRFLFRVSFVVVLSLPLCSCALALFLSLSLFFFLSPFLFPLSVARCSVSVWGTTGRSVSGGTYTLCVCLAVPPLYPGGAGASASSSAFWSPTHFSAPTPGRFTCCCDIVRMRAPTLQIAGRDGFLCLTL